MLWCDKYRPRELDALDYQKTQAQSLKNLTQDGDFPHLLFYGPSGCGKKTRIQCLLRQLYGPGAERLKVDTVHVTTPSGQKIEVSTVSSNHHIEVNPSDAGIHDRVVVMEIIKNSAQTQQLGLTSGGLSFKVIVLRDVDNLTKDAQHALRRTMERYIANCRIILCCTSISRVIPAIRSRCLCLRVAAPSVDEIATILGDVAQKESLKLPTTDCAAFLRSVAAKSDRNLRRALLMLEAYKVKKDSGTKERDEDLITQPDWLVFIRNLARKIVKEQSVANLAKIREDLYELMVFGVPSDVIFRELLSELLECDVGVASKVVEQAAVYEHRIVQGNKEIFHLEAFVAKCMCLYQNMMQELLLADF